MSFFELIVKSRSSLVFFIKEGVLRSLYTSKSKEERKMRVRFKNTKKLHVVQMFVNNALEYMNIHDLEHTDLNIRFVRQLDNGYSHGHATGDIGEVDITIATNFPFLMQLRTLAHELIHARQFFSGQLSSDLTAWNLIP